jgi:hypothetical protein
VLVSRRTAVPTAILAAVITIAGWYATYAYAKKREDRTRRIEIWLKYRQRQIEELYGPLLSLIEQIFNVWQVRENILQSGSASYSQDQQDQIKNFVWREYFSPLHREIGGLLRTKLYLLEGGEMPPSFSTYLEHATQEACQHRLWDELKLQTSGGTPWPRDFYEDVKRTLERLMKEHRSGLENFASS